MEGVIDEVGVRVVMFRSHEVDEEKILFLLLHLAVFFRKDIFIELVIG